ncbi:MAG: type II toxin-antitoxin system RelE/ParE family toxin [Gammaproteobacteria bacterium]
MTRIFKTRTFNRWMRKTGLSDPALCKAVAEMEQGLIDADMGGHIVKKRIGVSGRGKRGSTRTLVGTNCENRWFFLFGFGKNERDNIDSKELRALQTTAEVLLALKDKQIASAMEDGALLEICHDNQT